jgi:hypothetical protein
VNFKVDALSEGLRAFQRVIRHGLFLACIA